MAFEKTIEKYLKNEIKLNDAVKNLQSMSFLKENGIYIVRTKDVNIEFSNTTTTAIKENKDGDNLIYFEGHPKLKEIGCETLKEKFDKGDRKTLYIGKAEGNDGLEQRVKKLLEYSISNYKKHEGGRALWQIEDWQSLECLYLYYCEVEKAKELEKELLGAYKNEYGVFPVANWKKG